MRYYGAGQNGSSRWSTHTNNEEAAREFAVVNRDKLLGEYNRRKAQSKLAGSLYPVMKKYYEKNSPYLKKDTLRGSILGEDARRAYQNSVLNHWIPFLKKNHVKIPEEINTPLLARFQDYCLAKGLKPQTVNHYVSFVSNIFNYLVLRGQIKNNPCKGLTALKIKQEDQRITGCYEIGKIKGAFNRRWKNELSYLLSLIMYTTNMRNSEIERMQVKDIFNIDKIHFINIDESKTKNGVRIAPLHDFVYRKITAYVRKNKLTENDYIFKLPNCKKLGSKRYKAAYTELAEYAGYGAERLKKENITFYSGRHFWKTLMNSENLGDAEEFFMGHKVSGDVAKRYNHRDKQGKQKILDKAKKVFKILNAKLFIS